MEVWCVSLDSAFVVFLFLCFVFQSRIKACRVKPDKRSLVGVEDGRCAGKAPLRKGGLSWWGGGGVRFSWSTGRVGVSVERCSGLRRKG